MGGRWAWSLAWHALSHTRTRRLQGSSRLLPTPEVRGLLRVSLSFTGENRPQEERPTSPWQILPAVLLSRPPPLPVLASGSCDLGPGLALSEPWSLWLPSGRAEGAEEARACLISGWSGSPRPSHPPPAGPHLASVLAGQPRGRARGRVRRAPSSRCREARLALPREDSGGLRSLGEGAGEGGRAGGCGAGSFVLPGKPPTPPPLALLGKVDLTAGRSPSAISQGDRVGCSRRGAGKFDH